MAKKISDDIINQIPSLYKELGSKKKVAERLQISVASVSKYLNLFEANPKNDPSPRRVQVTDELIDRINVLYGQCRNMAQVARELQISPNTVKRHLSEESLKLKEQENDDRDALFYYIYRLFGQYSDTQPVSDWNITQINKFKTHGMPYMGQLLTLKYFFEIKKNPVEKANGSIGIIPYVYTESRTYYSSQAKKADELAKGIQEQLEKDRIEIKFNPSDYIGKGRKKKLIDLNSIEE